MVDSRLTVIPEIWHRAAQARTSRREIRNNGGLQYNECALKYITATFSSRARAFFDYFVRGSRRRRPRRRSRGADHERGRMSSLMTCGVCGIRRTRLSGFAILQLPDAHRSHYSMPYRGDATLLMQRPSIFIARSQPEHNRCSRDRMGES